jgi:hypothetical protein
MSCLLLVALLEVYIWLKMVCVSFSHMIKFGGRYVAFSSQEWKNYKVEMNKCNWFGRGFNWLFLSLIFSLWSYEYWEQGFYFQLGDIKILSKVSKKLTKLVYLTFYTRKAHLSKNFSICSLKNDKICWKQIHYWECYIEFHLFSLSSMFRLPYFSRRKKRQWHEIWLLGVLLTPLMTWPHPHRLTLSNL